MAVSLKGSRYLLKAALCCPRRTVLASGKRPKRLLPVWITRMSGCNAHQQIFQLRHQVRLRRMIRRHAPRVLHFARLFCARPRLDAPVAAVRLDAGIRFLFQPTERVRATSHVGEGRAHLRILAETFIETLAKAAERERIAEDKDIQLSRLGRRRGSARLGGAVGVAATDGCGSEERDREEHREHAAPIAR